MAQSVGPLSSTLRLSPKLWTTCTGLAEEVMGVADVNDVAAAIIGQLGPMDAMKLEKLAYYSQAWHVAIHGEVLFEEAVEAWAQGPVVETLYQQHRGLRRVHAWQGEPTTLPREAAAVVTLVCRKYGHLSGDELSTLTHAELPWRAARGGLASNARSRTPIDPGLMGTYYRSQELGGRAAPDLAVGGVHPLTDAQHNPDAALLELRKQYAESAPSSAPAGNGRFGRAGARARGTSTKVIREATRTRPA
jgi:uncharacterized phage-associated protein